MGWVVLCHGYLYMQSSGSVKNMAYTMTVQRRLISMLLPFGQFSVDTFFVSRHDIADIWVAFFQECQQYRVADRCSPASSAPTSACAS